jgi:hypothetical protein
MVDKPTPTPRRGYLYHKAYYTEHGRFDSVVKYLSGGDVPLRLEGLLERYVRNLNPRDPGPGRGATGFTVG